MNNYVNKFKFLHEMDKFQENAIYHTDTKKKFKSINSAVEMHLNLLTNFYIGFVTFSCFF